MWTKTTTRPNSHNAKDKPTAAHIPPHPISQTSTTQKAVLVWRYVDDGGGGGGDKENKPKSVIRISLFRTAKRNPLIFPI